MNKEQQIQKEKDDAEAKIEARKLFKEVMEKEVDRLINNALTEKRIMQIVEYRLERFINEKFGASYWGNKKVEKKHLKDIVDAHAEVIVDMYLENNEEKIKEYMSSQCDKIMKRMLKLRLDIE